MIKKMLRRFGWTSGYDPTQSMIDRFERTSALRRDILREVLGIPKQEEDKQSKELNDQLGGE